MDHIKEDINKLYSQDYIIFLTDKFLVNSKIF